MCIYNVTKEHTERERGQTSRQIREKGTASGGLRVMILGFHLGISSRGGKHNCRAMGGVRTTQSLCARVQEVHTCLVKIYLQRESALRHHCSCSLKVHFRDPNFSGRYLGNHSSSGPRTRTNPPAKEELPLVSLTSA